MNPMANNNNNNTTEVNSVPSVMIVYSTPPDVNITSPNTNTTTLIKNGDNDSNNNNNHHHHHYHDSNNNNLKGIEPPTPSPPTPPPNSLHQAIQTLPASRSGGGGVIGSGGGDGGGGGGGSEINSCRPNGVRLRVIDGIPYYNTQVDRRCQQRLTLQGKQVLESTNNTFTTTTTTTTTINTSTATAAITATTRSHKIKGRKAPRCNNNSSHRPDGNWTLNKKPCQIISKRASGHGSESARNTTKIFLRKPESPPTLGISSLDFENSCQGGGGVIGRRKDYYYSPRKNLRLSCSVNDDVFLPLGDIKACDASPSPTDRTLKTSRFLEDRVRAMYSQRRLNVPVSARNHSHRPRSATNRHRPHSSRGGSTSLQCPDGAGSNGGHHSMGLGLLAKFRLVARMTILLIRLMKAIIENSNDLTTRSAAELQWLTVYGRDTEATMAFNKNIYSRDRVMTHIPEWAMNILQREPECRTELHCRRLHALLRGLKSFDKFTDEIQMSLCRAFRLEIVTEGRIVLKHGHIGVYFYFIYSGSVFVNAVDKASDGRPFMRTITVLTRGQSFGELALLQDIKRTATVSVREKCELLVVDKGVFARVCPQIFEKELEEKRNVLSGMSLFPSKWWGPEEMRALSMEAQIQEFKINKVIVPDSSLEDWIYTCIEGKCQVIYCLSPLSKTSDFGDQRRKTSDIVLSEEIIDLLSSATSTVAKTNEQEADADIKEKLLSSLGLDYVATGKRRHAYGKDDVEKERLRAIQGLDDATTLTALMKKREETRKGLVYLNVGVIEPGEVFDLHSLAQDEREPSNQTSCLMLVSGGAKILKVRKAAFFNHASDQALEHTRTLASKERFLSDEALIESYKQKKKWERYKSDVVQSVLVTKRHTRELAESQIGTPCASRAQTPRPKSSRFSSRGGRISRAQTMSATSRHSHQNGIDNHDNQTTDLVLNVVQKENQAPQQQQTLTETAVTVTHDSENENITAEESLNSNNKLNEIVNNSSTTVQNEEESGSKVVEEDGPMRMRRPTLIVPSFDTDALIIRRHPARAAMRSVGARPHTVHPRFSTR